jgi:hypothetical protein
MITVKLFPTQMAQVLLTAAAESSHHKQATHHGQDNLKVPTITSLKVLRDTCGIIQKNAEINVKKT